MSILCNASDIHLRSSLAMGLSATSPFSITTWLNANWSAGGRRSLVGIYGPPTDTPLAPPVTAVQIGTSTGAGELSFWTWGGAILTGTATNFMNAFNGVWTFIAYTFDGTTHRGYRNGVQVSSSTTTQQAGFLNQVYINGFPGGGTSEVSDHQVDQYALFRRTLSADEILSMFNASGARHGIRLSQICRYEFDEAAQGSTATLVRDLSGNEHTLTPVGAGSPIIYSYTNTFANSNIRPVQ